MNVLNQTVKEVILIAGGDGLVGSRLVRLLDKNKYHLVILSRSKKNSQTPGVEYALWNTDEKTIDDIPAPDHIINLAGAGIADERWTVARKNLLISSRINSAATIKNYLDLHHLRPVSYISASAVGFYGDRADEILTEDSYAGDEFMTDCCRQWEEAAAYTGSLCQRYAILRIGIVLSMMGGALPKLLMTKKLGIFSYFGSGDQYYPWVHIDDLCSIFIQAIENESYSGVYNAVAPQQISNINIIREIMEECRLKGILIPAPSWILKIILGEMSHVILNSDRVVPKNLLEKNFPFRFTTSGAAVRHLIKEGI